MEEGLSQGGRGGVKEERGGVKEERWSKGGKNRIKEEEMCI